jgi:hypothetical protein
LIVVLLGVAGCGKTIVGKLLALETGLKFYDADDFHTDASRQKMRMSIPLTDADREPWLAALDQLVPLHRGFDGFKLGPPWTGAVGRYAPSLREPSRP